VHRDTTSNGHRQHPLGCRAHRVLAETRRHGRCREEVRCRQRPSPCRHHAPRGGACDCHPCRGGSHRGGPDRASFAYAAPPPRPLPITLLHLTMTTRPPSSPTSMFRTLACRTSVLASRSRWTSPPHTTAGGATTSCSPSGVTLSPITCCWTPHPLAFQLGTEWTASSSHGAGAPSPLTCRTSFNNTAT
jgi:hypothetical protein